MWPAQFAHVQKFHPSIHQVVLIARTWDAWEGKASPGPESLAHSLQCHVILGWAWSAQVCSR